MWHFLRAKVLRVVQVVEQAKAQDADVCLQAFFTLFQAQDAGAQLNGLALLRHVVSHKWDTLSPPQQQQIAQHVNSCVFSTEVQSRALPIRMQLAYALCDLAIQSGDSSVDQILSSGVPQLVERGSLASGPARAYVVSNVSEPYTELSFVFVSNSAFLLPMCMTTVLLVILIYQEYLVQATGEPARRFSLL
jgi:hypothetical protein